MIVLKVRVQSPCLTKSQHVRVPTLFSHFKMGSITYYVDVLFNIDCNIHKHNGIQQEIYNSYTYIE